MIREFFSALFAPEPEPRPVEPRTISEALRQTAEIAMDRGDLVTRGDCLTAAMRIDGLEAREAKFLLALNMIYNTTGRAMSDYECRVAIEEIAARAIGLPVQGRRRP